MSEELKLLPFDVKINHMTFKKGTSLNLLIARATDWHTKLLNTRASSWVSVEDRYPEEGRVIIYTPLTDSMTYRIVEAQFVKTCYDAAYWMPLPEPPR